MATLCLGCMRTKEESPVCEHCGYDERKENLIHQLPVGTMLQDQYLIGRVLGQGGFGITYLGWDQHLSAPVAIKEYYPSGVVQRHTQMGSHVYLANGEAPELFQKYSSRFLKEARTLAQLTDIPEIVQIKSYFSQNDTAYIVMEYVQGITLKEHLKRKGKPMTESEALTIMEPVLKALQKVHDHGLIHRDISPDNIMLPDSGGIKLIDFGTVRYMDDSGKSKSTETVLKPGFAPMEQYNARGNLGTWTDVYAICATFHYLLTGKVPADIHSRLEDAETLTALHCTPGLSNYVIEILEKGMKIRIHDRIPTVGELHRLLYTEKEAALLRMQAQEQEDASQKKRKAKGRLLAVCAAAAVGIVAAAMLLTSSKPEPEASVPVPEITEAAVYSSTVPDTTEDLSPKDRAYAEAEQLLAEGDTAAAALILGQLKEYEAAEQLLADGAYEKAALAFGKLGTFAGAKDRSLELWDQVARRDTVCAGGIHTVGLRTGGTVLAKGANTFGECNVSDWKDIIAVSAGESHTVGLKYDGTVVAVGNNQRGQCNVDTWTDIVAVSAGYWNTAGLKSDGTVITTHNGELIWTDIIDICTLGQLYVVGLKSDGTVITNGDINLSDWTDITAIASGMGHVVGLKKDGSVVAAGYSPSGQCDVKDWSNIIAVSASGGGENSTTGRTVGLRADGTICAVGAAWFNTSYWTDIVAVSTNTEHLVALRSDGTLYSAGNTRYGKCDLDEWTDIKIPNKTRLAVW